MSTIIKVDSRLQHPDKVKDVSFLFCSWALRYNGNGWKPFFVIVGIGPDKCIYRGISTLRETHNIIEYCKLKSIPLSNIIGIDVDTDICKQWRKQGITVINENWSSTAVYGLVSHKIKVMAHEQGGWAKVIMYANTRGCNKDIQYHSKMIDIVRPHRFMGLYNVRDGKLLKKLFKSTKYEESDLGFMQNSKHKINGIIGYTGIALHTINRIVRR